MNAKMNGSVLRWSSVEQDAAREERAYQEFLANLPTYVICPTCHYEREVGQDCGLPCV